MLARDKFQLQINKLIFKFSETACPDGYYVFKEFCIKIIQTPMTYATAKATGCKGQGTFWEDNMLGFWAEVKKLFPCLFESKIIL
jgi:hypothetical protein